MRSSGRSRAASFRGGRTDRHPGSVSSTFRRTLRQTQRTKSSIRGRYSGGSAISRSGTIQRTISSAHRRSAGDRTTTGTSTTIRGIGGGHRATSTRTRMTTTAGADIETRGTTTSGTDATSIGETGERTKGDSGEIRGNHRTQEDRTHTTNILIKDDL